MSFASPAFRVRRQSVVGMEGMHSKMFDPPTAAPATPDRVAPTNPVPEVMAAAGFQGTPIFPHTVNRQLMHGMTIPTWDGLKDLMFFLFTDPDNPSATGTFPAPTTRVPRGVIFHGHVVGNGPPPHTIHWHGIEPTAINDGVGHCSMEIGEYTYQWQPNQIGSYFYHCHRNTVQHFEFGLYGFLPIEPPDAFFASIASINQDGSVVLNSTPIGNGRPEPGFPNGRRRIAADLTNFPDFPGFNSNPIDAPDPEANNPELPAWLKFQTDPHAMTVPYDVEAIWVFDDRDSNWSDNASSPFTTFPRASADPGVDDRYDQNPGIGGFFAFNQFNSDYWFVTGVPVPAHRGETGTIPEGITIPPALNSGVAGTQVSIEARTGQTIFIHGLSASYNTAMITLPVDAVIISADGRALGVGPFGQYNHPFVLPAGTPIRLSVARRGDALIRVNSPINSFATVQFIDTRSGETGAAPGPVLFTARIPFNITGPTLLPPSVPTPVSPANGATVDTLRPALQWNDATPDPLEYDVEVAPATDMGFVNPVVRVRGIAALDTTFSVPAGALSASVTYRWRVRTRNPFGASAWSTPFTFRTALGPLPPRLVPPGTVSDLTPRLTWIAATGPGIGFDVQVSRDRLFPAPEIAASATDLADTFFDVPDGALQGSTLYFWRVRVNTPAGTSRWAMGTFRTPLGPRIPPLPVDPTLGEVTSTLTPTLEWRELRPEATSFDVQIATSIRFDILVLEQTGIAAALFPASTTVDVPTGALNPGTRYFWRVRGVNEFGASRWRFASFRTPAA